MRWMQLGKSYAVDDTKKEKKITVESGNASKD
jgi:hypothetical protein